MCGIEVHQQLATEVHSRQRRLVRCSMETLPEQARFSRKLRAARGEGKIDIARFETHVIGYLNTSSHRIPV